MKAKIVNCKVCGEEIAASAKTCPKCGAKNKKPIYKKWWFWVLIIVLIFSFAGSSGSNDEDIKAATSVSGAPEIDLSDSNKTEEPKADNTSVTVTESVSISETVLYEKNDIKITATSLGESWVGPEVKLLIENNSSDNVLITSKQASINGYMMPYAGLYCDIAAGKKANESLSFASSELKQAGIDTIANIEFYILVQDSENWDTIDQSELIKLESSASGYEQPVDDSGDIIHDSNGVKIVNKGLKQDIIWDGTLVFYMENNSNQPITVYAENVSVNGFMQDAGLWLDLRKGTRIVDGMYLLDLSDLQLETIDDIDNIEFNLRIVNADNWNDIATTNTITLEF